MNIFKTKLAAGAAAVLLATPVLATDMLPPSGTSMLQPFVGTVDAFAGGGNVLEAYQAGQDGWLGAEFGGADVADTRMWYDPENGTNGGYGYAASNRWQHFQGSSSGSSYIDLGSMGGVSSGVGISVPPFCFSGCQPPADN